MVQVECECPVVELDVCDLCDDLFEEALLPGFGGVGHHCEHGVVILFVLVVEEDQL